MRKRSNIFGTVCIMVILLLSGCGFENPMTPAGYEGYLYRKPYIFGKKEFYDTQIGQTSAGLSWRLFVINIDMRAVTKDHTAAGIGCQSHRGKAESRSGIDEKR